MTDVMKMKWSEYCSKEHTGSIYFVNEYETYLYRVTEGTGDNLLPEDKEDGYVDYWLTDFYNLKEKREGDGGEWLETKLISDRDYTIGELIERMKECDAPLDLERWTIQPAKVGESITDEIDDLEYQRFCEKYAKGW